MFVYYVGSLQRFLEYLLGIQGNVEGTTMSECSLPEGNQSQAMGEWTPFINRLNWAGRVLIDRSGQVRPRQKVEIVMGIVSVLDMHCARLDTQMDSSLVDSNGEVPFLALLLAVSNLSEGLAEIGDTGVSLGSFEPLLARLIRGVSEEELLVFAGSLRTRAARESKKLDTGSLGTLESYIIMVLEVVSSVRPIYLMDEFVLELLGRRLDNGVAWLDSQVATQLISPDAPVLITRQCSSLIEGLLADRSSG